MTAILGLLGCSETFIYQITEVPKPEIEVTPLEYFFDEISVGENSIETFTISNIGDAPLSVFDIRLSNSNGTFLLDSEIDIIYPDESADFYVIYNPITYEENNNVINILSNDFDEALIQILISGRGNSPVIDISPWEYQFPETSVGCESEKVIMISNVGSLDLIIDNILYTSNVPSDFYPESFYNIGGNFPWTIAPGDHIAVPISYIPEDTLSDNGFLKVYSNDLARPEAIAGQTGSGVYEEFVTETFSQDGTSDVDIMFVIDNSCSMQSNQINFKDNFNSFINAFYGAGIDYQIGFITTDSSTLSLNSIVSNLSADPIAEVNDIIDIISISGSSHEQGILQTYLATQPGEWAGVGGSFLRVDARLVVIYLSDEPDHSGSIVTTSQAANHLLSLKGSLSMVTAHAVAGDFPNGCTANGGAEFGDGYYDLVNNLSGTFLSICTSDWGIQMDALARSSILSNSFPLSNTPVEASIEAYIDGVLDYNWTFEESTNSVIFSTPPSEGSQIEISYSRYNECN